MACSGRIWTNRYGLSARMMFLASSASLPTRSGHVLDPGIKDDHVRNLNTLAISHPIALFSYLVQQKFKTLRNNCCKHDLPDNKFRNHLSSGQGPSFITSCHLRSILDHSTTTKCPEDVLYKCTKKLQGSEPRHEHAMIYFSTTCIELMCPH